MGRPGRVQKEQVIQLGQKVECSCQGPGRLQRCGGDVVLNPIGKGWSLKVSQQRASRTGGLRLELVSLDWDKPTRKHLTD